MDELLRMMALLERRIQKLEMVDRMKHNFMASAVPGSSDDVAAGYNVGSFWIDGSGNVYICVDTTKGVAVWVQVN